MERGGEKMASTGIVAGKGEVALTTCQKCDGLMAVGALYHDDSVVNKEGAPMVTVWHAQHSA
jgi:hypothetical protein